MQRPTIALVVGHEPPPYPPNDPGAVNKASGVSEFTYNNAVADMVLASACNAHVVKVLREPNGYGRLPGRINNLRPDYVVSLHCNGFRLPTATGSEVLYWHTSKRGKHVAEVFIRHIRAALGLRLRGNAGIIPIAKGERGHVLLGRTSAPAVLLEPFFITSDADFAIGSAKQKALAQAYTRALDEIARIRP